MVICIFNKYSRCVSFLLLIWQIIKSLVAQNIMNLLFYSSGDKKSKISFSTLKSRCWQDCFLLEALRGESVSLTFSASNNCWHFLACGQPITCSCHELRTGCLSCSPGDLSWSRLYSFYPVSWDQIPSCEAPSYTSTLLWTKCKIAMWWPQPSWWPPACPLMEVCKEVFISAFYSLACRATKLRGENVL